MASPHSFQSFTLRKKFFSGTKTLTPASSGAGRTILIQEFEALHLDRMKTYKYPGNTQAMTLELHRCDQVREQHKSTTHL